MELEFDPAKDESNIAKHGVSLARAAELNILRLLEDERRDYGELRYRAWGLIDGDAYCLAFAVRNGVVRPISLRRAHDRRSNDMSRDKKDDDSNPEWTDADFKRAKPPQELLSADVLKAFPKTRGPQKAAKKVPVSLRLSLEVVERFKADGPGWQSRIDEVLKKAVGL